MRPCMVWIPKLGLAKNQQSLSFLFAVILLAFRLFSLVFSE